MLLTNSSSLLPFSRGATENIISIASIDHTSERKLTAVHQVVVVEHTLGEGLTRGGGTKVTVEAEGLGDGQVSLDREHRGTSLLLLAEDLATTLVEARVDTTDDSLRALDLDQEDGLLETGLGEQAGGVADTTANGDDLSSTTVNGISVKLIEATNQQASPITRKN